MIVNIDEIKNLLPHREPFLFIDKCEILKIGKNCLIGGQAGIGGHLIIEDNVTIAAKSGVTKNIKKNSIIAGFPAVDIKIWKKNIINQYRKIK